MKVSPAHRQALDALRRDYERALPGKLRALEDAVARLIADGPRREALESTYHLAHRLRGSAALYGFDSVASAACAFEELLLSVLEGRSAPDRSFEDELAARTARLVLSLPRPPEGAGPRGDPDADA
jgi:chemotaxis protein histidine kinase CheA